MTYELETLREFEGGPAPIAYYVRGRVDLIAFEELLPDGIRYDQPRHEYWRCMPVADGKGRHTITVAKAKGRGAFLVTVAYL